MSADRRVPLVRLVDVVGDNRSGVQVQSVLGLEGEIGEIMDLQIINLQVLFFAAPFSRRNSIRNCV